MSTHQRLVRLLRVDQVMWLRQYSDLPHKHPSRSVRSSYQLTFALGSVGRLSVVPNDFDTISLFHQPSYSWSYCSTHLIQMAFSHAPSVSLTLSPIRQTLSPQPASSMFFLVDWSSFHPSDQGATTVNSTFTSPSRTDRISSACAIFGWSSNHKPLPHGSL